jgi:hypothetical protein
MPEISEEQIRGGKGRKRRTIQVDALMRRITEAQKRAVDLYPQTPRTKRIKMALDLAWDIAFDEMLESQKDPEDG